MSLESNLAGTRSLAAAIDAAASETVIDEHTFAKNVLAVPPVVGAADLAVTVTTLQGPIRLADYVITRCVEAVVHGCDLIEPVEPDKTALAITAEALLSVMAGGASRPWSPSPRGSDDRRATP